MKAGNEYVQNPLIFFSLLWKYSGYTMLYQFRVYSMVILHLHMLTTSGATICHHKTLTLPLTVFPVCVSFFTFHPQDLINFISGILYLPLPFTHFFPFPPILPSPLATVIHFVLCIYAKILNFLKRNLPWNFKVKTEPSNVYTEILLNK